MFLNRRCCLKNEQLVKTLRYIQYCILYKYVTLLPLTSLFIITSWKSASNRRIAALEAELRVVTQPTRVERERLRRIHFDESTTGASDDMFALGMRGSRGDESKDKRGRSAVRIQNNSRDNLKQKSNSHYTE